MGLGGANFDSQSHRQLYDKIHDRAGASAAQVVDDAWNSFRAVMGNARSDLQTAIEKAGAVWVGAAGERFTSASAPLVRWAEDARAAGVATHHSFQAQRSSWSGTATRMPAPVEVTSTANDDLWGVPAGFTHLVGGQTDQDVQEAQALEAKREAVRVMVEYQTAAMSAVGSLGAFTPPPSVATRVAEGSVARPEEVRAGERDGGPRREDVGAAGMQPRDVGSGTTGQSASSTPGAGGPPPSLPGVTGPSGSTHTSGSAQAPAPHPQQGPTSTPLPQGGLPGGWAGGLPGGAPRSGAGRGPGGGGGGGAGRPGGAVGGGTRGPGGFSGGGGTRGTGGFGGTGGLGGHPSSPTPHRGTPAFPAAQTTGVEHGAAHPTRPTPPSATRGAPGAPGAAGPLGSPQRGRDEDDLEHKSAEYLEELDDVWGQDGLPKVAPPVIGDVGP
ncbi:PPE domain-containing protein [Actinosynnema mirum]|uniref:PPE domain-containing protein n=1 Tax=Actinosynnema mirum (strain ATCC 29888 / DSM 43827 / JCM 3225 / NBRC 14064 / NCIMB 13271 / NRRL B-12336 / IMRU 3971 / 101) TaxID=446462 RepID=C6WLH0_ACTMD|nr:PPE domain-containing protein [Actinosynnema mirum]ACU38363.1 hypothetical protein Amir_4519 [Actinosynnema mirum DSM 43827]